MPANIPNPGVKFNLPFTLGLPDQAPPTKDPEVRALLDQVYNAFQGVQLAFHHFTGIGQQLFSAWPNLRYDQTLHLASPWRYYVQASETINYGSAVNVFNSAGTLKARNADATNNTKPCHGFNTTVGGIPNGSFGEVILQCGMLTGVSGLTLGTRYFLFAGAGGLVSASPAVGAGNIEQAVGWAIDTTALLFNVGFAFVQH